MRPSGVRAVAGTLLAAALLAITLVDGPASAGDLTNAARPVTTPASLLTRLEPLWRAVASGDLALASPLFFPRAPYVTMKTGEIPAPASDYAHRLWALYQLDLATYHRALATGPAPRLVGVRAVASDVTWIPPGDCENRFGYWHLGEVRLEFRRQRALWSVGVFSLISWAGHWYVVHLGPNPRPAPVGTLDHLVRGPGVAGAGGC